MHSVFHFLLSLFLFLFSSRGGFSHLSFCGNGNPSKSQEILGGGLPFAMHFNDTDGPG